MRSSSPMVRHEVLIQRPTKIYLGSTRRPPSDSKGWGLRGPVGVGPEGPVGMLRGAEGL